MKKNVLVLGVLMLSFFGYSQQIIWTGNASNNDFFDETNWEDINTNLAPASGTIDANQAINLDLQLHNASATVFASGIINLGTGTLSVTATSLQANAFAGGSVSINNEGYVDLSDSNPLQTNVSINFTSGIGWVRTLNLVGNILLNNYLSLINVNGNASIYQTNLRLDNYYLEGTVIRSNDLSTAPLTIYDGLNLQGTSANLSVDIIHNGLAIPNAMDNKAESFILKKGFMATFAIAEDGTSKSKNYIASEDDLIIDDLPDYLKNDISFVRVVPWNWVTKKGRSGTDISSTLNNTWNYRWWNNGNSSLGVEYAPMAFGRWNADNDADVELYKNKYKATHVMGFNEPDDCNAQSGIGGFCNTDLAVSVYENLMKTGLRLVSPGCRENAAFSWLKEFHDKANVQDIRMDVIAVHWYDWGSNPANSPNADPIAVFNRFKNYLQNVHDLYGLPIWITEFNANPNRSNATNYGFMQLALPYLETLDYVERYAWFQPSSGNANYYGGGVLTNVGNFYKDQVSTPSITEDVLLEDSNLDIYYYQQFLSDNNLLINGDFELGNLTGWLGTNTGITTFNQYEGTTAGRIINGGGSLYQIVSVEGQTDYYLSLYSKWYNLPPTAVSIKILNASDDSEIASKTLANSLDYNLAELDFTVPLGVNSIKVIVEIPSGYPIWLVDNVSLTKTMALSIQDLSLESKLKLHPNPSSGVFVLKSSLPIESYGVYDIQGRLIKTEKKMMEFETEINLTSKGKGVYFLVIRDNQGNQSSKKIVLN